MGKIKVAAFSISLDGFGAGPNQSLENPMGAGAGDLHRWFFNTKRFHAMVGKPGGVAHGVNNEFAERSFANVGAWIMGRNMFGPIRGPWPNEDWKGLWGPNTPYHVPVYVLTRHARPSLEMEGGTVFHFETGGAEAALAKARAAADGKDVRVGGGVATVREYLKKSLIDEIHLVQSPTLLGSGESLFAGLDLRQLGYEPAETKGVDEGLHVVLRKA